MSTSPDRINVWPEDVGDIVRRWIAAPTRETADAILARLSIRTAQRLEERGIADARAVLEILGLS